MGRGQVLSTGVTPTLRDRRGVDFFPEKQFLSSKTTWELLHTMRVLLPQALFGASAGGTDFCTQF